MAAKKRLTSRSSIVERDGRGRRAEVIVDLADVGAWARRVDGYPPPTLHGAGSSASLVLDRFGFMLYAGDDEISGDHDGDDFVELAVDHGAEVLVVSGIDLRRARPDALADAASAGSLRGALVTAYRVDTL